MFDSRRKATGTSSITRTAVLIAVFILIPAFALSSRPLGSPLQLAAIGISVLGIMSAVLVRRRHLRLPVPVISIDTRKRVTK